MVGVRGGELDAGVSEVDAGVDVGDPGGGIDWNIGSRDAELRLLLAVVLEALRCSQCSHPGIIRSHQGGGSESSQLKCELRRAEMLLRR